MVTAGQAYVGSVTHAISIDSVVVSVARQLNRHATGAALLTVTGAFLSHTAARSLQARVAASAMERTVWLSESSVYAMLAAGVRATRRIVLTAGEGCSSLSAGFSLDQPSVSSLRSTGRVQAFNISFESL